MTNCPLCLSTGPFAQWMHEMMRERRFLHCAICDVVFVPRADHLDTEQELAHYATHENTLDAKGFREYLSRTVREIAERVPKGSRILDFGSGPEPSMAILLSEAAYKVEIFDPNYAPNWPARMFDAVLVHEVFEHLREPARELTRIFSQLAPDGRLIIRIEVRPDEAEFRTWWYARDPTHVLFPSEQTFSWIANSNRKTYERWSATVFAIA